MSRFNVMPRTNRLRGWLAGKIAPPGWLPDDFDAFLDAEGIVVWDTNPKDEPVRIIPPDTYTWISPPDDMPPPPTTEELLRKLEAKDKR